MRFYFFILEILFFNFLFFQFENSYSQICAGTKVILLDTIIQEGDQWVLDFEDDFNGNALDLSKWELKVSSQGSDDGTGTYFSLDNVTVSPETHYGKSTSASGVCIITIKKETVTRPMTFWDPNSPVLTYNYTAADIWSKYQYGWGKYEIRCKIPKGRSFWSSAYMYGQQNDVGNEIDIFEFTDERTPFGNFDETKLSKVWQMHYHMWDKTYGKSVDRNCGNSLGNSNSLDFSLDFHIFTVIWDRWGMSWYLDNKLIKTAAQWYDLNGRAIGKDNIKKEQVVLRNDWYPIHPMSIIFGLSMGKFEADNSTPLPNQMIIDYVRYYKLY